MNEQLNAQGSIGGMDPMPTSPDPLNPIDPGLDPVDNPALDELPSKEGEIPLDDDDTELNPGQLKAHTDDALEDETNGSLYQGQRLPE